MWSECVSYRLPNALQTTSKALMRLPGSLPATSPLLLLLLACLSLSACFLKPHKIDVQQGNHIDPEAIAKLKPEMTRSQVRFLLGTPLLTDAFHPDRWDYLYIDRRSGRLVQEHRLTLWFDGDQLKRAVTDAGEPNPVGAAPSAEGKQSSLRTP
jgi:outer membrane protein assembly factor BamE